MGRLSAAVVAMEVVALLVALLGFGPIALVVGLPLMLSTVVMLVAVWLSQFPRQRLEQRRAARFAHDTPEDGGLMSGFFEVAGTR